ncbi:FeoB-associated Cys-rich membrane protein [bacterium]|nr:FeoB-associated Cys-rich membrane protein [bacterium]
MVWQNMIIAVVVAAALTYIVVQIWKTMFRKSSACCDKGCAPKQQVVSISIGEVNRSDSER